MKELQEYSLSQSPQGWCLTHKNKMKYSPWSKAVTNTNINPVIHIFTLFLYEHSQAKDNDSGLQSSIFYTTAVPAKKNLT